MNELPKLVENFAKTIVDQNEEIDRGNSVAGNKHAKKRAAIFKEIVTQGDHGRDALAVLLEDKRLAVRVMTASYLLRHCEDRAIQVLELASKEIGIVGFGAAQALKRWHDGSWSLDPATPKSE